MHLINSQTFFLPTDKWLEKFSDRSGFFKLSKVTTYKPFGRLPVLKQTSNISIMVHNEKLVGVLKVVRALINLVC